MTPARRILAFDQDDAFLKTAGQYLTSAGVEFCAVREPSGVLEQVASFKPDLILLDRAAPGTQVGEVAGMLRSSSVPLAFVLHDSSERELIRALQAHAVEVMQRPFGQDHVSRILQLLDELAQRPRIDSATWEDQVARNFVDMARRHRLRGSLVVNRGTPFEGLVVLKDGLLVRASYGPLTGMEAVREILQLEDGVYELDASLERPPQKIAHSATELEKGQLITLGPGDSADIRPRVLAVDDEPDMLTLVSKHLTRAGFEVSLAPDGAAAVEAAIQTPFDLIVADLSMPRMDGWEMLKVLKSDHRTSEVPVIFISAHDDYRDSLRAARAGAHDYLAKTGRSETVVNTALKAITPRLEALFQLLVSAPVAVRAQVIGLQWCLRALARLQSTGTLELKDDWGRYRLDVRLGQPVAAVATVQQRQVGGVSGFARMMVATRAQGAFVHQDIPDPPATQVLTLSMEELIVRTCEGLNAAESRAMEARLASATELDVDPDLYELFCRVAPARKVAFAQAYCEKKLPLQEVGHSLKLGPEQTTEWFQELLRRGVIKLRGV
ncbi:MAG TPA: response regulator [Myxococcales bacterium]|nr:response regulator [Myxococcales bacterium]